MEHTKRLLEITKDYAKILESADKVKTIKESDELKVKALGYWKELQRQLNRAYREMLQITRETRTRVNQDNYANTLKSVRQITVKQETIKETIPVAQKSKGSAKKNKKAKK